VTYQSRAAFQQHDKKQNIKGSLTNHFDQAAFFVDQAAFSISQHAKSQHAKSQIPNQFSDQGSGLSCVFNFQVNRKKIQEIPYCSLLLLTSFAV